ncbi:hypothetical protein LPJ78_002555 [Coemansia sp. RSA 989]|nr:kinase-like domain-containing protein [Coemansia mojavensis]KAJ1738824.1 hypothetical protein LPJ68_005234 [Coemansia sp. RSA 1086]KAJ1747220.1 hypothetical protein LPJ79_005405 [Coemansia sp. RSA 1821]KAJ1865626.1 hypothetical protein LPJ78_002555 [Coemansia sp. RSA 989]KAJ1872810.1 hypothetical protein LPJ55_002807 [Coemansia sp. RSA 990]KAJ2648030.1 hypothetical protein IWW40_004234 [Coemansia sp. RSA 1250]KAJ2672744.1 hypothetical protein IWW42_002697 [Coemansia sp. RSA 1085]
MAHDGRHFIAAPLKSKPAPSTATGTGLPQLEISRCMPPSAPLSPPKRPDTAVREKHTGPTVVVDRKRVLGTGQYSTVCLGLLDTGSNGESRPCAIKIPHNNLDARELALIEAAGLWQAGSAPWTVGCMGIVNLGTIGEEAQGISEVQQWPAAASEAVAGKGEWALVLEYCDGGSCWSWMETNRLCMDAELFCTWTRQLAAALVALKAAGVAHMDIKPHNLLLTDDCSVRLADFTAAQFSAQTLETMQLTCPSFDAREYPPYTDFSGTIPYCAPEALAPNALAKARSSEELHKMDIYSLGVTLYTLFVSGREPYATVKSAVEQMLLASKGAFWEWEERHYIATLQSAVETAPATPIDMKPCTQNPTNPPPSLSRSRSLGPRPVTRRRTLKSRKAAPREFRRLLSGDILPVAIESLLRDMVDPDPSKRPDAVDILRILDSIESDIFEP